MKSPLALACDLHEIADRMQRAQTAAEVNAISDLVVEPWLVDAADTASRLATREMEHGGVL